MRRLVLLCTLASITWLSSCKKDSNNPADGVDPSNAPALSKAVKVWHGQRLTGNPPAPNNNPNGPQLDPSSNNQSITAVTGRFAVIKPEVYNGSVAGYYVQVNGANEYFKIDYSKPIERGSNVKKKKFGKNTLLQKFHEIDSTGGNGTLDSAIVITIPANIQPGQFCISYCAYDSLGNISNIIVSCVNVIAFGGDASVAYLNGKWSNTGYKDVGNPTWEPTLYVDSIVEPLTCVNNKLEYYCPTTNCTFTNYTTSISGATKSDMTFGSTGGLSFENVYVDKWFDYYTSTCSNFVYEDYSTTDTLGGAWSYNSSTQKLTLVFDFSSWGLPDPEAYEFSLQKISNNEIHLHDAFNGFSLKFQK